MRGSRLATVALSLAAAVIVLSALPHPPGADVLRPLTSAVAVDQDWRIFAPEPRREGVRIEAVTEWSDGRRTAWRIPSGGPLLGAYRDYRWRKWAEYVASDEVGPWLWGPFARYALRRLPVRPGARPQRLRIVRYSRSIPPPGSEHEPAWTATELYSAELGPAT
jgi:hypothetical protein